MCVCGWSGLPPGRGRVAGVDWGCSFKDCSGAGEVPGRRRGAGFNGLGLESGGERFCTAAPAVQSLKTVDFNVLRI